MWKELYVGMGSGSNAVQGMKDLALRCRPVGEGIKPPYAALVEDRCGERYGKDAPGGCQVGIRETVRSSGMVFWGRC
jgi:hypothetical protein